MFGKIYNINLAVLLMGYSGHELLQVKENKKIVCIWVSFFKVHTQKILFVYKANNGIIFLGRLISCYHKAAHIFTKEIPNKILPVNACMIDFYSKNMTASSISYDSKLC